MEIHCYDVTLRYAVFFSILLLKLVFTFNYQADSCDWIGSGLRQAESSRGVQPIYLRCTQGHIEWHYPRGALRVVLRHGTSGRDFRGCIRVGHNSRGARIYLEGHRKLHLLYSQEDGRPINLIRCFTSTKGQIALYVESEPVRDQLTKETALFSYDLQTMTRRALNNDLEECRPCTDEELLRFYCTADFVLGGTISSLYHQDELQQSEITIRTVRVIRDSQPSVFSQKNSYSPIDSAKYAILYRPLKCGTKSGSGEYLFLGRWILGNPTVQCAPRYSQWKKIRRKAIAEGTNQCQVD